MFVIFFRVLTLFVLGGLIAYGAIHAVKYIKKKHDIGLTIIFVLSIIVVVYAGISWFIPLD